ncbi:MAG: folate family ECF transporter S component [Peptostreptococcaceae bacterium]|nr:folate family ECF transporter S component [Peptostreptococcaceae bacterium]
MNNRKISTRSIVLGGIFVAASIVLTRFFGFMIMGGTVRIAYGSVPLAMAGIILGPIVGTLAGVVADLVGVLLMPQGTFFPGFTLSSALQGLIPALIVHKLYIDKSVPFQKVAVGTAIAIVVTTIVVALGLNTLWLTILFKKAFMVLLPTRVLASAIIGGTSILITVLLLKVLRNKL